MNETYAIFKIFDTVFFVYFATINSIYLMLLILGSIKVFQRKKEAYFEEFHNVNGINSLPDITFIIPALNEEKNLFNVIKNITGLSYENKKIIIVNDGSKDGSLNLLKDVLELISIEKFYEDKIPTARVKDVYFSKKHPNVLVIDKENGGGKFDALNAALNATRTSYYITIDADTFLDDKSFIKLLQPIYTNPDIIGVGAAVCIRNGCSTVKNILSTTLFPQSALPLFQNLEYMRSFLQRDGWNYLGGNFVIAGAFSVFKTDAVLSIHGYVDTVAEDMEIVIRLHRFMRTKKCPYKIIYLPDPVAWTQAPSTLKDLARQRKNWQRGILDSLWYNKSMCYNVRYGLFGYFVYPFCILGEALEPLIEVIGMIYVIFGFIFGITHVYFVLLFMLVTIGFNILFTALCIVIEEFSYHKYPRFRSLFFLFIFNVIENIGYRQLLLVWRIKGIISFFKNFKKVQKISSMINAKSIKYKKDEI